MRILLVCNVLPNPNSGAAGSVWQVGRALRAEGHEVDEIWADSMPRRVAHHSLHSVIEQPRMYRTAVMNALRRKHFDVVQVSQPQGFAAARALRALAKRPVFIHKSHGLEARVVTTVPPQLEALAADDRPRWRRHATSLLGQLLSRHDREIVRYADGHLVGCTECRDYLVTRMRAEPSSVELVPTAPPESYQELPPVPVDAARLSRVLYVGQFAFIKGPHRVAEVFGRLASADERLTFTWVCSAQHHEQVRSMCSPALRPRLRLLDWRDQSELRSIYDEHGIFVFPSLFEGFSKALLEAMARGLCPVASDVSGARDLLRDGENGFQCAGYDTAAMAERVLFLRNNPELAAKVSRGAAETASRFSWRRTARAEVEFFARLLDGLQDRRMATS